MHIRPLPTDRTGGQRTEFFWRLGFGIWDLRAAVPRVQGAIFCMKFISGCTSGTAATQSL